jgi:ABC-type glycerol-3-phosphate transport system permease component
MLTNASDATLPLFIAVQNTQPALNRGIIGPAFAAMVPIVIVGLLLERFIARGLVAA